MAADVEFRISASNRGAMSALRGTRQELGHLERQSKHTGSGLRAAERDLGRASRGALAGSGAFRHLGRSVAFASGAFLGAAGFVGAVRHALKEAIDLNSQIARSRVVFGEHAKEVVAWSQTTEHSLSLAGETSLKTANNFGTMLTAMGLAPGKAAALAKEMTKVAAAVSLARGEADPTQAAQAISVALAGRGRALRQYGIILDDANIKAEALRLGLVKTERDSSKVTIAQNALNIASARYADNLKRHGKNSTQAASAYNTLLSAQARLRKETAGHAITLTNAQKAQAASNLVLRQGRRFTDDYGRLLNTTAGRQRRFNEGVQNLREELGTAMLPTFNKVLDRLNAYLSSLSEGGSRHEAFVRVVAKVSHGLQQAWSVATLVVGVLRRITSVVGGWDVAFKLIIGAILANKFLNLAAAIRNSRLAMIALGTQSKATTAVIEADAAAQATAMNAPLGKVGALKAGLKGLAASPFTIAVALVVTGYFGNKLAKRLIGDSGSGPFGLGEGVTSAAGDLKPVLRNGKWVDPNTGKPVADQAYWNEQARKGNVSTGNRLRRGGQPIPSVGQSSPRQQGIAGSAVRYANEPEARSASYAIPGGRRPQGFQDCSSFTQAVYRQNGISIGGNSVAQWNGAPRKGKNLKDAVPGDLLFYYYHNGTSGPPDHVAIYIGGGRQVEDHGRRTGVTAGYAGGQGFYGWGRYAKSGVTKGPDDGAKGPPVVGDGSSDLYVDHPGQKAKKAKKPRYADPETIRIEDRRIREEEAAVRAAAKRGFITPAQEKADLARLERLRKELHAAHLKPAEERDIADRVARLWKGINKTISAGAKKARAHAADLAKAHAKAVSDAEKVVNRARDRLGQAWDLVASRALEGFDRVTQKGEEAISAQYDAPTPAEAALAALQARRTTLSNVTALSDARSKLDYARAVGDPQLIKDAQAELEQAQLDAEEEGLSAQAEAERKARDKQRDDAVQAYDDMRQLQRDKLDLFLQDLKQKLDDGTITWKQGMDEVKAFLQSNDNLGDFGALGGLIGATFTQGLLDALTGIGGASDAVDTALRKLKGLGYRWNPDTGDFEKIPATDATGAIALPTTGAAGILARIRPRGFAAGAVVTRPMLAAIGEGYQREAVLPLTDRRAMADIREALGGGGGNTYIVNLPQYLGDKREVAHVLRAELLKIEGRQAGPLWGK